MTETIHHAPSVQWAEAPNDWILVRSEESPWSPRPQSKPFDVLVVEDDPVLRRTIAFSLQAEGYRVMGARDGADAFQVLQSGTPWIILLDLRLPGMNGADFAAELRARGIPSRIAVVTGTREADEAAREIGADDYLAKPFEVDDLVELVHRHRAA